MRLSKYFIYATVGLCVACGTANDKAGGKPLLMVSIEPQRAILEKIAGEGFEVVSLMPAGANPETFEPSMSGRAALARAEVFFTTGVLPFEQTVVRAGVAGEVIDTSCGIEPVYGTHDHHGHEGECGTDGHGAADPHVWSSVRNLDSIAASMTVALCRLRPDSAAVYASRYAELHCTLDSIDRAYARRLAEAPGRTFAVWHPSLSYFARDYGLEQLSVGYESKEVSAQRLREAVDNARAKGVRVLFFQKEFDSRQAETLNELIGSRLVTVNPGSYDWKKEFDTVVDEICRE